MRSFIIVEVEHGDTTDPFDAIIHKVTKDSVHQAIYNYTIIGYTVAVDLPPYITSMNVNALLNRTS